MNTQLLNLTAAEFYGSIGGATVLLGALQFFLTTWFKGKVEASIKAEYDRQLAEYKSHLDQKLEDYKNEAKIRERAAGVAGLLAHVKQHEDIENPEFLKMAWELSLWLPADIHTKLKDCYYGLGDDDDIKAVLLETRRILLGANAGEVNPDDIPPLVHRVDE